MAPAIRTPWMLVLALLTSFQIALAGLPGDIDGDGDVDQQDSQQFKACQSGPAIPQIDVDCRQKTDLDADGDVDMDDFGILQRNFTGPGCQPAAPGPRCTGPDMLADLTETLQPEYRSSVFNPTTGEYRTQVTLTNNGTTRVECPFLVIQSISVSSVTLRNASGVTGAGDPYVSLGNQAPDGILEPGESTAPLTLRFDNPSRQRFTFDGECRGHVLGELERVIAAPESVAMIAGERAQLVVTGQYSDLPERNLTPSGAGTTYCSSAPDIVLVSPQGMLLALRPGRAVVNVSTRSGIDTFAASAEVNVAPSLRSVDVVPGRILGEVLDASNEQPVAGAMISAPGVTATAQTGTDGRFVLPVELDGHYLVKIEKPGYTFVQRHADVPLGQDAVVERAYLTPLDQKTTPINAAAGGTASDSSGTVEVVIPAGALPNDMEIRITPVKEIDHLVGIQPGYGLFAFGAQLEPSPITFARPVTLRVKHNLIGVQAGNKFPLTKWDESAGEWLDIGELTVSGDAEWLEASLATFSYVHCNCSHPPPWTTPFNQATPRWPVNRGDSSCPVGVRSSFVEADTGYLREDHHLPAVQSLGRDYSISLVYNSGTVTPGVLFTVSNPASNLYLKPDLAEWEITVAGTARRTTYRGYAHASGHAYLWDGRNNSGQPVATGSYPCRLVLIDRFNGGSYQWVCGPIHIPGALLFRQPVPVERSREFTGRITIENLNDSEFGAGWKLGGVPRLHFSPDGAVLLTGPGGPRYFLPDPSGIYVNEPGETSVLQAMPEGKFQRTLKDQTVYLFTAQGRCSRSTDRNGNVTRYEYDAAGWLTSVTDPADRMTTLTYDEMGRLTSITDPAERVTHFVVDVTNNLTRITNPDSSTVQFQYDAAHRLTSKTDQRGHVYQYAYDSLGRISRTIAPNGSEYNFIPRHRLTLANPILAAGGGVRTDPATAVNTDEADPDDHNEMCGYTDERGTTTLYRVDERGAMLEVTRSNSGTLLTRTTVQRDSEGYAVQLTRPNGAVVRLAYDTKKNVKSVREESIDATTSYTYDEATNQVTSITDALGRQTTFELDEQGNVVKVIDPLNNATELTYDTRGLLGSVTDAEGATTTLDRDEFGNIGRVVDAIGNESTVEHDNVGNVLASIDANLRRSEYTYDLMNRLLSQRACCGGQADFAYDSAGNLLTVTDGNSHATHFGYDVNGRLESMTDPLGLSETYGYTLADELTVQHARTGDTTAYGYDALGRLLSKTSQNQSVSFLYNNVDDVLLTWDARSTLRQSFDLVSRLVTSSSLLQETDPSQDRDHDCLTDDYEVQIGLDPDLSDSDGNGILDGAEDPDSDTLSNCDEMRLGTNPLDADSDGDFLKDQEELRESTDPLNPDTDGDGFADGDEVAVGTDPLDAMDSPPSPLQHAITVFNHFGAFGSRPVLHDFSVYNRVAEPEYGSSPLLNDFSVFNRIGEAQPLPVSQDFTVKNLSP